MLDAYLARLGYDGPRSVDLDTLTALHRAHLLAVPYENLEIQLGRTNVLDEGAFVDKLVERRRGAWCYEMNGTFTMALTELGFEVTRVAGAVGRETLGDVADATHMVGLVDLDGADGRHRRYVVDVGLGQGPLAPFPLAERDWTEGPMRYSLERLDDRWWRFHNDPRADPPSFDLREEPMRLADYQRPCTELQTNPMSPFVRFAIVIRRTAEGFEALRDTTHVHFDGQERTTRELTEPHEYRAVLRRQLGVDLGAEVDLLWREMRARATARGD